MPHYHPPNKGRRRFVLCGVLTLSLLLSHRASFALNADAQQMAEGIGTIIKQNQARARAGAINDALRKAIEQALLTTLDPNELVAHAQALENTLYARTLTYIRSYRVLWEYPDLQKRVYRVGVEANLALSEIDKTIQALGFSPSITAQGRLLVLIIERRLERPDPNPLDGGDGVVAQTLRRYLDRHNLQTVRHPPETPWDGEESSALMVARQVGAEAVLIGQATAEKVHSDVAGTPVQTVKASVDVQVLTTATGRRLTAEHLETMARHTDATIGGTQALRRAATELASRLTSPLRQHLTRYEQGAAP